MHQLQDDARAACRTRLWQCAPTYVDTVGDAASNKALAGRPKERTCTKSVMTRSSSISEVFKMALSANNCAMLNEVPRRVTGSNLVREPCLAGALSRPINGAWCRLPSPLMVALLHCLRLQSSLPRSLGVRRGHISRAVTKARCRHTEYNAFGLGKQDLSFRLIPTHCGTYAVCDWCALMARMA
jgi:hypothetical protein